MSEQVFGPGRPAAARKALAALEEMRAYVATWGYAPGDVERLRVLRDEAAMYYEYADSSAALARM